MADYTARSYSNMFRVKDLIAFKAWAEQIGLEVHDTTVDSRSYVTIESTEWPGVWPFLPEAEDDDTDTFVRELSKHLADDSVAILFQCGREKFRYLAGEAVALNSRGETVSVDLAEISPVPAGLEGGEPLSENDPPEWELLSRNDADIELLNLIVRPKFESMSLVTFDTLGSIIIKELSGQSPRRLIEPFPACESEIPATRLSPGIRYEFSKPCPFSWACERRDGLIAVELQIMPPPGDDDDSCAAAAEAAVLLLRQHDLALYPAMGMMPLRSGRIVRVWFVCAESISLGDLVRVVEVVGTGIAARIVQVRNSSFSLIQTLPGSAPKRPILRRGFACSGFFRVRDVEAFLAWAKSRTLAVYQQEGDDGALELAMLPVTQTHYFGEQSDVGFWPTAFLTKDSLVRCNIAAELVLHLDEKAQALLVECDVPTNTVPDGRAHLVDAEGVQKSISLQEIYVRATSLGGEVRRAHGPETAATLASASIQER